MTGIFFFNFRKRDMKKEGDFNQNKDVTESWNDLSPH